MPEPFTIRIFVPDGDPEGVRIIDRMNWTGVGYVFPRSSWESLRCRPELLTTGVYILVGYSADDELPILYIGQADGIGTRIDQHQKGKDFWDWAVVFTSTSGGLNRAHVTWLEYALIARAQYANRCHLENGTAPSEPRMTEAEKADTEGFLREILQILPLVGLRALEMPKTVAAPRQTSAMLPPFKTERGEQDTIIVPAQKEGFERVFIGEKCWYAIRISGGKLPKIKYIAGYQTQPISAVTHVAPVSHIEPYGESGKFKVVFSEPPRKIGPIPYGNSPMGAMQGPRYTTYKELTNANSLDEILKTRQ
ncbi:GIY-YIG nuclease family protein [Ruegeria atlantica]|uniref:GIY-YIG nuclease family protein n=1 Tax=Ruegeria atlantica TaxID=81569 RepID=UPI001479D7D9|nr:GIY-YIG nuclease family protein [Ruegeria atlantica]